MSPRIVFDTSTVVSALIFTHGRLAWLGSHWREGRRLPLISKTTATELMRVLAYPKLKLSVEDRRELMGDYLSFCEVVPSVTKCRILRRDIKDQLFLDLAESGKAESVVSDNRDWLVLAGKTNFSIESPEMYRARVRSTEPTA